MQKISWILLALLVVLFGCTTNSPDQNANLPVFTQNHLQAFVIESPNCSNCFSVNGIIRTLNVPGKYVLDSNNRVDSNSAQGQQLIQDYNIKTLPSIVVTGSIKDDLKNVWISQNLGTFDENALVLRQVQFPYFDITQKRVKGEVEMIILYDANCLDCQIVLPNLPRDQNGLAVMNQPVEIAGMGSQNSQTVFVSTIRFVNVWSIEGKEKVNAWEVSRVPVVALSSSAEDYDFFRLHSGDAGFINQLDGWLVNQDNPPFIDLLTGQVKGLVHVTFINDANCFSCFNGESAYRQFLEQYNVRILDVNSFDWNSTDGLKLVKKYRIEQVPTIILTSDVVYYTRLAQEWTKAWGTIELDQNFVFRNVQQFSELSIDHNVTYTTIDLNHLK